MSSLYIVEVHTEHSRKGGEMIQKVEVREYRVKDSERFRELVEDSDYTFRTLSEEVGRELRKMKKPMLGSSKSTMANLASGDQVTVRRDVAKALTKVLRLKRMDRLFVDDVYTVHRETGHRRAA